MLGVCAGPGLAPSRPVFCFLSCSDWVGFMSFPLVSPGVAVTDKALSRWPAVPEDTPGLQWGGSREMELRKDGRESLLVIWVLPSTPGRHFLGSLGPRTEDSARWALADEGSVLTAEASPAPALASAKLEEQLRDFSGRAADLRELCTVAEGDRFMLPGLAASVRGFWGPRPFPLVSGKALDPAIDGLSTPSNLVSPCVRGRLASSLPPSAVI